MTKCVLAGLLLSSMCVACGDSEDDSTSVEPRPTAPVSGQIDGAAFQPAGPRADGDSNELVVTFPSVAVACGTDIMPGQGEVHLHVTLAGEAQQPGEYSVSAQAVGADITTYGADTKDVSVIIDGTVWIDSVADDLRGALRLSIEGDKATIEGTFQAPICSQGASG